MRQTFPDKPQPVGLVSIHASVKDATQHAFDCLKVRTVSIHASVKDATCKYERRHRAIQDGFNPRICKRCDFFNPPTSQQPFVSIHASVKDATAYRLGSILSNVVSIHASVKDATKNNFLHVSLKLVSIHASVKDATE